MSGPAAKADQTAKGEEPTGLASPKHNQEQPVVWERWQKKRTFVRALEGTYSHLTKELLDQPRGQIHAQEQTQGRKSLA